VLKREESAGPGKGRRRRDRDRRSGRRTAGDRAEAAFERSSAVAPALFLTQARAWPRRWPAIVRRRRAADHIPGRPHEVRCRRLKSEHARIIAASSLRTGYEYFICSLHRTGPRASNGSDAMPYTAACSDYTLHDRASRRTRTSRSVSIGTTVATVSHIHERAHVVRSCSSSRETRTSVASS
jgi:hypothetical protein